MKVSLSFFLGLFGLIFSSGVALAVPDSNWIYPTDGMAFATATAPSTPQYGTKGVYVEVDASRLTNTVNFYVGTEKVGSTYYWKPGPSGMRRYYTRLYFPTTGPRTLTAVADDGFSLQTINGPAIQITIPAPAPILSLEDPTSITSCRATLNGRFDTLGSLVGISFEYGPTTDYGGLSVYPIFQDTKYEASIPVSCEIKGLQPETLYHYRLKCVSSAGTFYGPDGTFTTGANEAPVPRNDVGVLMNDGIVVVGCVFNDLDDSVDNANQLKIVSVSSAAHGTVEISLDARSIRYTAGSTFPGEDVLTYTVADPLGLEAVGTVYIRNVAGHYAAIAGSYASLLASSPGYYLGSVSMQVTRTGAFSGVLTVNGINYPFSGGLPRTGEGEESSYRDLVVSQAGGPPVAFGFVLNYDQNGLPQIAGGSIRGPFWDMVPSVQLMPPAEAAAEAGNFNVMLPKENAELAVNLEVEPQGNGFAQVRVAKSGHAKVVGRSGDNKPLAAGARLRRDHKVLLNAACGVGRRGRITGLMEFNALAGAAGNGDLTWINQARRSGVYSIGFSQRVNAIGEKYVPPAPRTPVLAPVAGPNQTVTIRVRNHDGSQTVQYDFTLNEKNEFDSGPFSLARVRLKVNPRTGLFSGTVKWGLSGRPIRLMGIVLRERREGGGTAGVAGADAPIEIFAK